MIVACILCILSLTTHRFVVGGENRSDGQRVMIVHLPEGGVVAFGNAISEILHVSYEVTIIMAIFKCCFTREYIDHAYKRRCEHKTWKTNILIALSMMQDNI